MNVTKMHGLGNDFILFHDQDGVNKDYSEVAQRLCDRRTGIGADGIMVVMPSEVADIRMRIINADGSEAEMCGNGIRCFAKYAFDRKLVSSDSFTVETLAGIMTPTMHVKDGEIESVTVNMGKPSFSPREIPMKVSGEKVMDYYIELDGNDYLVSSVLMGVPHTEVFVDDIEDARVEKIGPIIEKHPLFPKGTNVNFIQVVNDHQIKVRTWERGAGATLACGTGCCAAVVMAYEKGLTGRQVEVEVYLWSLHISYEEDGTVYMTGPAAEVFETSVEL